MTVLLMVQIYSSIIKKEQNQLFSYITKKKYPDWTLFIFLFFQIFLFKWVINRLIVIWKVILTRVCHLENNIQGVTSHPPQVYCGQYEINCKPTNLLYILKNIRFIFPTSEGNISGNLQPQTVWHTGRNGGSKYLEIQVPSNLILQLYHSLRKDTNIKMRIGRHSGFQWYAKLVCF